ncbi:MAG: class I SAM-dependent methyltransferase [Ferruginibacter sp.]
MATKQDIDFTYSSIDKIFRLSFGEMADYSGAKFDGDFSLSVEEGQRKKHQFIAESLNIKKGSKVLDMACGWGPFLNYLRHIEANGKGVTLSKGQAAACVNNGLDVEIMDCRTIQPETFGPLDAVTCIGGLEHFCSVEEYMQGKQDEVYTNFFKNVSNLLPAGGRFYMQTMVFAKKTPPLNKIDIHADKNSIEYILALMLKQFPGSWLPVTEEQVIKNAAPFMKLISKSSGRLDYIQTINCWRKKFRKFNLQKYLFYASLIPKYIFNKDFRHQVAIFKISPNKVCFEAETMEHYRLVFEKI